MNSSDEDVGFSSRRLRQSRRAIRRQPAEEPLKPDDSVRTSSTVEKTTSSHSARYMKYRQSLSKHSLPEEDTSAKDVVPPAKTASPDSGSDNSSLNSDAVSVGEVAQMWSQLSRRLQKGMAGQNVGNESTSADLPVSSSDEDDDLFSQQSDDMGSSDDNCDYSFQRSTSFTDAVARMAVGPPEMQSLDRRNSDGSSGWDTGTASSVYTANEDNIIPLTTQNHFHDDDQLQSTVMVKSGNSPDEQRKQDEKNTFRQSMQRKRSRRGMLLVFGVLLAIIAIVLGLTLTNDAYESPRSIDLSTSPPTLAPYIRIPSTMEPTSLSPSLSPIERPQGDIPSYLRRLVLRTGITSEADLEDADSAQSMSLRWLSLTTATLDIPDWRYLQRYALATFYYSTEGRDWFLQNGWLGVEHECTWFFRSPRPCNDQGVLLRLSLGFNNLGGTLPPELGLLSNIEDVSLSGGGGVKIGGTLPEELRRWTKLEYLSLRGQDFNGALGDALVSSWSNLTRIDLTSNRLGGNLPPSLSEMSLLRTAILASNEFTGTIPGSYGSLAARSLGLGDNKLSGSFPTGIMQNMRDLSFERNMIESMADSMVAPRLRRIVANDNAITGELPHFSSARALEMILLQNNTFTGTVPDSWSNLVELEEVDISSNQLEGEIPAGLTILPSLGVFRFDDNSFSSLTCPVDDRREWYADCLPVGGVPEIECPCCTHCCADNIGCNVQ